MMYFHIQVLQQLPILPAHQELQQSLTALEKKVICANIDKGTIKIQGPNHYATIDYGDGTCDKLATVSIDGGASITFLLR